MSAFTNIYKLLKIKKTMRKVRKVSLEAFDELTVMEASKLYGGNEGVPPTTMPVDSTAVNDSTRVEKSPIKQTITGGAEMKQNGSTSITLGYTWSNGRLSLGSETEYNTKDGWSGKIKGTFIIGGDKKKKEKQRDFAN